MIPGIFSMHFRQKLHWKVHEKQCINGMVTLRKMMTDFLFWEFLDFLNDPLYYLGWCTASTGNFKKVHSLVWSKTSEQSVTTLQKWISHLLRNLASNLAFNNTMFGAGEKFWTFARYFVSCWCSNDDSKKGLVINCMIVKSLPYRNALTWYSGNFYPTCAHAWLAVKHCFCVSVYLGKYITSCLLEKKRCHRNLSPNLMGQWK